MRKSIWVVRLAVAAAVLMIGSLAQAAIIVSDLGTAPPPASLGGFALTAFPLDPQGIGALVSDVASPLGGVVGFSPNLTHAQIGLGWATWSHGYTGDVYYDLGTSITMTLPAGTGAFVFYAEPNDFGLHDITGTTSTGETLTLSVLGGSGAKGWGVYGDAGEAITSITVTVGAEAGGLAVGEFLVAWPEGFPLPEPPSVALLAIGGLALAVLRRR
jgi:hypothetical protein